jgi:phosphoserine phosphatase
MSTPDSMVSLSAIGLDSPGLVSTITTKIFEMGGNIVDVEEYARRDLFFIFLVIDFSTSSRTLEEITSSLKAIEDETGLRVSVGVYDAEKLTLVPEKENHIVTILGVDHPGIIARISTFFHQYNINIENCRMIARGTFFSMEMVIDTTHMVRDPMRAHRETREKMKDGLKALCAEIGQSVVIQSEDIYKRSKKLVVFDVETTLIQESSLKDFLEKVNQELQLPEVEMEPMEVDEGDEARIVDNARTLKGIPRQEFESFSEILQLNPGALELIGVLKSMGFKIALLSSGFNFFIKRIFEEAGVDYAFSNTLKVDERGIITGELEAPIITSTSKNEILDFIMNVEHISREQVIAVGDGSTRCHFIKNVGLSIAFKPDEKSFRTDGILSSDHITNILYCLGIPKRELDKYVKAGSPE